MHIVHTNKAYYPHIGGIETVVRYLAEGLSRRPDLSVEVLACGGRGRTVTRQVDGVPVRYVAQWGTFSSIPISPAYPVWLARYSGDILEIHEPFPLVDLSVLLLARRIASRFRKAVVWWHSDIIGRDWAMPFYAPLLRRFLDIVDRIIVATPDHITSSRFLPDVREKCEIVPYGIPLEPFQTDERQRREISELRSQIGRPLLLFVGRLVYYKGLQYLVEAMQYLRDSKLVIIGSGTLKRKLERLAEELEVDQDILFLSYLPRDELITYYHACDVFILPSTEVSEAFGIVQLEAMACGKPVVSTNLETGITFVNQHGKTGLTVPPRSPSALADAVRRLLGDDDLYAELSGHAQRRVHREFSQELMIERTLRIYRDLLAR